MAKEQTANEAYAAAKNDIANLLGWFDCLMGEEPKEIDWAVVGSFIEVRKQLIQTLAFISGFTEKRIEESLEDLDHNQNEGTSK